MRVREGDVKTESEVRIMQVLKNHYPWMWTATRSPKRQGNEFSPQAYRGNTGLPILLP